jgi:hypothetical protein
MDATLTCRPALYKTDKDGNFVMKGDRKVEEKILGLFTFRTTPSIRDNIQIDVARARLLEGMRRDQVEPDTYMTTDILARLSLMCEKAPDGWDWNARSVAEVYAVWVAFGEKYKEIVEADQRMAEEAERAKPVAESPATAKAV